jgi:hypothetical protein
MADVKLNEQGFAFVDVFIRKAGAAARDRMPNLSFKVDSGACSSTISIEDLIDLGYTADWVRENGKELTGEKRPSGFSGEPVDGLWEVTLPFVRLGLNCAPNGCRFITRLDSPRGAPRVRLLLGTDVLSNFNWFFDYDRNICSFAYRKNPSNEKGAKRMTLFCSIDEIEANNREGCLT